MVDGLSDEQLFSIDPPDAAAIGDDALFDVTDTSDLDEPARGIGQAIVGAARVGVEEALRTVTATFAPSAESPVEELISGIGEERPGLSPEAFGSALGQVAGQFGAVAGTAAAGGSIGGLAGGVLGGLFLGPPGAVAGAAVGGEVGATAGSLIGAGLTFVQGIRRQLNGVEEEARARGLTEEQIASARDKALVGSAIGQGLGLVPITRGFKIFAPKNVPADKLAGEALKSVGKLGFIKKKLADFGIGATAEGTGEAIEEISAQIAIETEARGIGFVDAAGQATRSERTRDALIIGAFAGGTARAILRHPQRAGQSDVDAGLNVIENAIQGEVIDPVDASAIKLAQAVSDLKDGDSSTTEVVVTPDIATNEAITSALSEDGDLAIIPTEDGNTSIILAKARRLEEITPQALAIEREAKLERKIQQRRNVVNDLLSKAIVEEGSDIRINTEELLTRAEAKERELLKGEAKLENVRQLEGISTLTKGDKKLLRDEYGGLSTFFEQINDEELAAAGLERDDIGTVRRIPEPEPEPDLTAEVAGGGISLPDAAEIMSQPAQLTPEFLAATEPIFSGSRTFSRQTQPRDSSKANATNLNPRNAVAVFLQRNFASRGLLPPVAFDEKLKSRFLQEKIRTKTVFNIDALNRALNKAIPETGREAGERRRTLLRSINEYMVGDFPLESLPASVRDAAATMRGHIDDLSRTLIDEGAVQGDLALVVEGNEGIYLNRNYRIHDTPKWVDKVLQDEGIMNQAIGLFQRQNPRRDGESIGAYDQRIDSMIKATLFEHSDAPFRILNKSKIGSKDVSILKKRNEDLPPEIKLLFGERTDAIENYARTAFKQAGLIANHRFLSRVKEQGHGDFLFKEPRRGFEHKLAAESTESMAPLNGLYTSKEIAEAFQKEFHNHDLPNWLKFLLTANGVAKYSKTILNPITHVRNFGSNIFFMIANGNMPTFSGIRDSAATLFWTSAPDSILRFIPNNEEFQANYQEKFLEYVNLGILNDNAIAGELQDVIKDSFVGNPSLAEFANKRINKAISRPFKAAETAYQNEDNFWKILNFEAELSKLMRAFPDSDLTSLKQEAAKIVRDTTPTYSLVPEAAKKLRRFPAAAPFVSFFSEVIRNTNNIVQRSVREISVPETRAIGAQRMAGLVSALSIPEVIRMGFKTFSGLGDEEEEAVRELGPPWDRTGNLIPLPYTEEGFARYVNASYSDPLSLLKDPIRAFSQGETLTDSLISSTLDLLQPFLAGELFDQAITDIRRNTDTEGDRIWLPADSDKVKIQKALAHVWGLMEPGVIDSSNRLIKAATNERTASGRPLDLSTELIALMSGQRIVTIDPIHSIKFKSFDFVGAKREAGRPFSSIIQRQGRIRDQDIEDALSSTLDSWRIAYENIGRARKAALRLRGDYDEVTETMAASGITESDILAMEDDSMPRYRVSDTILERLENIPGRIEQLERVLGSRWDDLL